MIIQNHAMLFGHVILNKSINDRKVWLTMITLKNVSKTYETKDGTVHALQDVNLTINKGDIFGIIGMSGAGKSTLVRCLNFLERPTSGTVEIEGRDLLAMSEKELRMERRGIAMIFQHFNLLMQKNVIDNVCFPLKIAGVSKADARKRATELLEIVGLSDKAKAYPVQLSGGQKQRVAIAGVIAMEPKCIVLDEPTAMLDPMGRKEVLKTVQKLREQKKVTVILITHYMEEVVDADKIYVMDHGHVVMEGTPKEIFSQVDTLKHYRLDVPQVTILADELKKRGLDIPDGILTKEELVEALCQLK